MPKEKNFALDLGTTKFCFATIVEKKGEASYLDTVSIPAQGMRRGMLSDFSAAQNALKKLVELSEHEFNMDIHRVVVGVSGCHLHGRVVSIKISLSQSGSIEPFILGEGQSILKRQEQQENREILHIIPLLYKIDDREWILNPLGFSGSILTIKYYIVDADKHYIKDMIRLCNSCGLEVKSLIAEPYASASVSLDEEKKELGVVVADIGGGTTDGIIFKDGYPIHIFTINIGGKMLTSDLSIGLGIPQEEAERVKVILGLRASEENKVLKVRDVHGNIVSINTSYAHGILQSRIVELSNLINKEIVKSSSYISCGVYLTGGGSEISEIEHTMSKVLKMDVHKAKPQIPFSKFIKNDESIKSNHILASKYATVSGLLYLDMIQQHDIFNHKKAMGINTYIKSMFSWIRELS